MIGFERESDARRFLDMMRTRFEAFALTLHAEKTRLIEFGRFAAHNRARRGLGKPETFNFLGFTLICGSSRRGKFLLKRKTRRDRVRAKLMETKEELKSAATPVHPRAGAMAQASCHGLFRLSCRADEYAGAHGVP